MKANPVGWFEIYVQNMSRAKMFYETVFNTKLSRLKNPGMNMWAFPMDLNSWGAGGALVKMKGVPSGGSTLVYFSCADCAVEEKRAKKAGGSVHKKKTSIGKYGYMSLLVDTEGNMIGLHSLR